MAKPTNKWKFVTSSEYHAFIKSFKEKGFVTHELESIHRDEYDFYTYINLKTERMVNIAYCDPCEYENKYQINVGLEPDKLIPLKI